MKVWLLDHDVDDGFHRPCAWFGGFNPAFPVRAHRIETLADDDQKSHKSRSSFDVGHFTERLKGVTGARRDGPSPLWSSNARSDPPPTPALQAARLVTSGDVEQAVYTWGEAPKPVDAAERLRSAAEAAKPVTMLVQGYPDRDADRERALQVNLWGVIHGAKLFGRPMIKAGRRGTIINVASMGGFTRSKFLSVGNTSKAPLIMLFNYVRAEFAGHGAHVATICSQLSFTNITQTTRFIGLMPEAEGDKQSRASRRYPRRNRAPGKIARAILDAVESRRDHVSVGIEAGAPRLPSRLFPSLSHGLAQPDLLA